MHLGISTIIIWTDNLYYSVDYAHVTNKPRWYFKIFSSLHIPQYQKIPFFHVLYECLIIIYRTFFSFHICIGKHMLALDNNESSR